MSANLAQVYLDRLAQFEGRRFCSVAEAATYLDISRSSMDELLNAQKVHSQWYGSKLRKVVVSSLIKFADERMPIEKPKPGKRPGDVR